MQSQICVFFFSKDTGASEKNVTFLTEVGLDFSGRGLVSLYQFLTSGFYNGSPSLFLLCPRSLTQTQEWIKITRFQSYSFSLQFPRNSLGLINVFSLRFTATATEEMLPHTTHKYTSSSYLWFQNISCHRGICISTCCQKLFEIGFYVGYLSTVDCFNLKTISPK